MIGSRERRDADGEQLTSSLALDVGRAVASAGAERVVVGRDSRLAGDLIERGVSVGLREAGADVRTLGIVSTPTVARAISWEDADVGVMVVASDEDEEDNGIKLWNSGGLPFTDSQRAAVSRRVIDSEFDLVGSDAVGTETSAAGAIARHVSLVLEYVGSLEGLDVVVDVGHGAGQVTAKALAAAGADVRTLSAHPAETVPIRRLESKGTNDSDLQEMVEAVDADLGIAQDLDADRMLAIDGDGRVVGGDQLLAILADIATSEGERIVVPVDTSRAVDDRLDRKDVEVVRTAGGEETVPVRAAATEDVVFAGDPSGSWIWPVETYAPDAPLTAAILAEHICEAGPLSRLVDRVDRYPIRRENLAVAEKDAVVRRVSEQVDGEYDAVETVDGVRVDTADGWFSVRASGTDPLVKITAEADARDRSDELFATAMNYVEAAR